MPALAPSYAHDPDIDPDRPGYAIRHDSLGLWWSDAGFIRDHRKAKVFDYRSDADRAQGMLAGSIVTSVPRRVGSTSKGPVVCWTEYPAEALSPPESSAHYKAAQAWGAIGRAMGGGKP